MNITTTFSPGDSAWVFTYSPTYGPVARATVGQVRVTITDSPGNGDADEWADNFKAQPEREEQYMCIQTGIGSGTLYTLGENIFATEEEARTAWSLQEVPV